MKLRFLTFFIFSTFAAPSAYLPKQKPKPRVFTFDDDDITNSEKMQNAKIEYTALQLDPQQNPYILKFLNVFHQPFVAAKEAFKNISQSTQIHNIEPIKTCDLTNTNICNQYYPYK